MCACGDLLFGCVCVEVVSLTEYVCTDACCVVCVWGVCSSVCAQDDVCCLNFIRDFMF